MITISGIEVNPGGDTAPSLYDVGYGLSAIIRYGGHVYRPWSVLEHSYACAYYAAYCGDSAEVQLHALIHDAHESVTGDVVRPWKTPDMSRLQEELDRRIWTVHGIPVPDEAVLKRVKEIDDTILAAEKKWFAPQYGVTECEDRATRALFKVQALVAYTNVDYMAKHYQKSVEQLLKEVNGNRAKAAQSEVLELQPEMGG